MSAPIAVGSWWQQPENGTAWVVTERDVSGLVFDGGKVIVGMRRVDQASHVIVRDHEETIREHWTRLDGPPEPPQGTVYVIGKTVWHADDWGHIAAAAGAVALEWSTVCGLYDTERLATLQIVHTLGVE